jgi:hypothetical protein
MYSRRLSIEEKRNKRKAFLFITLTFGALLAMFFYGLPAVVKFAAFLTEINQSSQPVEVNDTTPPPPPRIESLPEATKDEKIEIKGNTEAGSHVTLFLNDQEEEVLADANGKFSFSFTLSEGENHISAQTSDSSGNVSQKTETQVVSFDDKPPTLEVTKPVETEFFGSKQRQLVIEGTTEDNVRIQVNQRQVVVEQDGSFAFATTLSQGQNNFTVVAEDHAGNKTEKTFMVNFTP